MFLEKVSRSRKDRWWAQKSSKFMLEIMTLVSSANNIGFDIEFIHGRRLHIYYGPRIDPW